MEIISDTSSATARAPESATCGGAIAGSIFGTIICIALIVFGAWWLYKKYWKNKSVGGHLVLEDPENLKVDYAFDNPAFKGDNKSTSPFDNKWKTPDKRKTVDDSYANAPIPRLVPLRGSDFTGLGIEVCGGLKDGIYVKKIMPQGPAVGVVNRGDKITSITIDFRHIVQEDAATILSYASPYNVQLELIEGKGTLLNTLSQNINLQSLTHPLYRSSSQEDLNTIERNARKKLFTSDDSSYFTLKMDQQQSLQQKPRSPIIHLPQAHEEHEKKNSLKKIQNYFIDMVEEKFQTKSAPANLIDNGKQQLVSTSNRGTSLCNEIRSDTKKGTKFGIRVLPPNVNDKDFGKSPSKVLADNDNNSNLERIVLIEKSFDASPAPALTAPPPEAMKRSKNKTDEAKMIVSVDADMEFDRQISVNSSEIRRNAAGIPHEIPSEMMQAALTARENRKENSIDRAKSKGKAPRPPSHEMGYDMNDDIETINKDISMDTTDSNAKTTLYKAVLVNEKLNFSDNFTKDVLHKNDDLITEFAINNNGNTPSNATIPKNERHSMAVKMEHRNKLDHDSDIELNGKGGKHIELNSDHITVHQTSEEDVNEERRTASLGDLSKLEFTTSTSGNRSNTGTLERAQSLEMQDPNSQLTGEKPTQKKRKATLNDQIVEIDFKEPRLGEPIIDNLESLQTARLKSAYEWGNLEDAIYGTDKGNNSDTDSIEIGKPEKKISAASTDMMTEVLAAADKFDREINDIELNDVLDEVTKADFNVPKVVNVAVDLLETNTITWESDVVVKDNDANGLSIFNESNKVIDDTRQFLEMESSNGIFVDQLRNEITHPCKPDRIEQQVYKIEGTSSPVDGIQIKGIEDIRSDQLKLINHNSNISEEAKVSRYPFGSFERPKSEVLKKLIATQQSPCDDDQLKVTNGVTTTKILSNQEPVNVKRTITTTSTYTELEPISLTLSGHTEIELNEASQIPPVFSSDGHGVNSISISSTESSPMTEQATATAPIHLTSNENVTTISTDETQPSSIILIDDENIDFTLRTIDNGESKASTPPLPPPPQRAIKNEVFIIESLSSKKVHETSSQISNDDDDDDDDDDDVDELDVKANNFVTEICLSNSNKDEQMNAKNISKSLGVQQINRDASTEPANTATETVEFQAKPFLSTVLTTTTTTMTSTTNNNNNYNNNNAGKPVIVEEDYIPRNSEIRFTTSTYPSPRQFEKRHSHIDQIRSTFERNHTSEIPVPIRKLSTPSTPPPPSATARTSPSKIPVFNSQKSSDNLLKNNGNGNRVSVSVTSIKNSSRNPSGK